MQFIEGGGGGGGGICPKCPILDPPLLPYKVSHLAPTLFAIFALFLRCDVIADKAHSVCYLANLDLPSHPRAQREGQARGRLFKFFFLGIVWYRYIACWFYFVSGPFRVSR